MLKKPLFSLLFVFLTLLCSAGHVWAWSSTIPTMDYSAFQMTSNAFATHQFLCQKAHDALMEHPVLKAGFVRFPEAEAIFHHGSINQAQAGLGPDNPNNSLYSWHWYNPSLKKDPAFGNGLAPKKVAEYLLGLKNIFMMQGLKTQHKSGDGAHEAAYLGHFIQDMTCAYHIVGVPIPPSTGPRPFRLYRSNASKKDMIGGPIRTFSETEWDEVVERSALAFAADPKADWFDPNYYDGRWPDYAKTSSHFLYETLVEVHYKKKFLSNKSRWNALRSRGMVSPLWKREQPADEFAIRVAEQTLSKYRTHEQVILPPILSFDTVEIPYDDWWKAIQATYTLWRSTISALMILEDDLKLVKLPGQQDMYELHVVVRNMEPEADADQVSVAYEIPGIRNQQGKGSISRIGKSAASDWCPLSGKIYLPDVIIRDNQIFYRGSDLLRVHIAGRYPVPDAEETLREFFLSDIRITGIVLPDMTGWKRLEVEDYLESRQLELKMGDSAGAAPTVDREDTVKSQQPAPDTVVAPGDRIQISLYDQYKVKVPNVTKPPLRTEDAIKNIKDAKLIVEEPFGKAEVGDAVPEGLVVNQNPEPGTWVLPQSKVKIGISVHRSPPPKSAFGIKNCYASIDIKPQTQYTPVDKPIELKALVTFYSTPYGGKRLNIPLDEIRFEWKLETHKKEDWPPGEVAVISWKGPVATLTPLSSGSVFVNCSAINVKNENLAVAQVVIYKKERVVKPAADIPDEDDSVGDDMLYRDKTSVLPQKPPSFGAPRPSTDPVSQAGSDAHVTPVVPAEENIDLTGIWDTTRGIVIDIRRVGGHDYEGKLVRLTTPEKIKYYKVPIGYRIFRARQTGPGTYICDFMGGISPKTGDRWFNNFYTLVVKGNKAQVKGGITWIRASR